MLEIKYPNDNEERTELSTYFINSNIDRNNSIKLKMLFTD